MKAEITTGEKKFAPIDLKITIETREEFDALFSVVDYSSLVASALKKNNMRINEDKVEKTLYGIFETLYAFKKSSL